MSNKPNDDDLERCTLHERREIIFQLRNLIRQRERLSVTFDEGRQSFLTVLIGISDDLDSLYFDIGGSEEINRAFLRSERCQFISIIGGIRIQFSGKRPRIAKLDGEQVFAVALPKTLLRLQRRETYRLPLPTTKPFICRIRRGMPEEKALPIYDISVGGIGIQVSEDPGLEALEKLENCWIDLRDSGMLAVSLEVRYIMTIESRSSKMIWHIGCMFLNLSPMNETMIQRFMAKAAAKRRALLPG